MSFVTILTLVVSALLFFGLAIGLLRGWVKSLTRFIIALVSFFVALFVSPAIASSFIAKNADGSVLTVLGRQIDFKEIVESFISNQDVTNDIFASNSTTNDLAVSLMKIAANIGLFLIVFFLIMIVSLIVYWIVFGVIYAKNKRRGDLKPKKVGNRLIGGGLGILTMVIVGFVVMLPAFGVMNICDKFLENQETSSELESASAYSPNGFMCSNLYYTEDEKIGKVEGYVEKYAAIRKEYNSSSVGTVFNALGISSLGERSFNYLTNVKTDDLNVNLTDEFVSMIHVYNAYKKNFVGKTFDIKNNDSIEGLKEIYVQAKNSEILKSYITELIPKFVERWSNDEAFLGIKNPVATTDKYYKVFNDVLQVFVTEDINRISSNLFAILNVLKVANNNELLQAIVDQQIPLSDYLETNTTFVNDAMIQLSSTNELRDKLPTVMNDVIELLYREVVDPEASFEANELTNAEKESIVWEHEAATMQTLTNKLMSVYSKTKDATSNETLVNEIGTVGEAIDLSRESKMLSKPLKTFISGFIKSDAVRFSENDVDDEDIKLKLDSYIVSNWNKPDYKYTPVFCSIGEAAKIANKISNGTENVTIDGLKDVLKDIVNDESGTKETIKDLLNNSDLVGSIVGEDSENKKQAEILTDMLESFIDNATADTIDKDIDAGQKIVDVVSNAKQNNNNLNLGETEETKKNEAKDIVDKITSSNTIVDMIEKANNNPEGTSALKETVDNLGGDVSYIKDEITNKANDANTTEEEKENLKKLATLFGLPNA